MSIADQKGQLKELQKLNKKAGAQLAQSRKVTQLHAFLLEQSLKLKQEKKQSLFFSIAAAINAFAKTPTNYLKKNPEAIAESFWGLLERRMLGVDGDGVRISKTKRGTTWLGAWGRKNGIDDLQALVTFAENMSFDFDVNSIIGAMFAAVAMTKELQKILETLIKNTSLIDRQIYLIEKAQAASEDESDEATASDDDDDEDHDENGETHEKKEIPTTAPAEAEDEEEAESSSESGAEEEDQASIDGFEVKEAEAEEKTAEEIVYDRLIEVHGATCEAFFAEIMNDELFLVDVTDTMKKRRAEEKAAAAATKKRKADEPGATSPEKEARISSEEDEDEDEADDLASV
jgi:hypothetical protein